MVVGGSVLVCGGWEERVKRSCIVNEEPWRAGGVWSRHSVTNYRHVGAAGAVVGGSVLLAGGRNMEKINRGTALALNWAPPSWKLKTTRCDWLR